METREIGAGFASLFNLETFLVEWKHAFLPHSGLLQEDLETFLVEWKQVLLDIGELVFFALETFLVEWKLKCGMRMISIPYPLKPS